MARQCYGIPYMGSKWRLADWILSYLPDTPIDAPKDGERVFVDLFAGGCAMTHAAIKSGRFDKVIANDLSFAPQVFKKAVEYGAYDWKEWVSREEFKALDTNTVDGLAKALMFGFGYKTYSYGYSNQKAQIYKNIFECVVNGDASNGRCNSLERLRVFESLHHSCDLSRLVISNTDFANVDIPDGSIVYCDPPYLNTSKYDSHFDYSFFEDWLARIDCPVFVSEFSCPTGCALIVSRTRNCSMAKSNDVKRTEGLYIQSRFLDWYREVRPDVVLECDC